MKARTVWAVLITILIIVAALAYLIVVSRPPVNPPVGAVLYLWYGYDSSGLGGHGSPGWNVSGGSTGGYAVVDKPTIGYYVSDANSTFRWQIQQMELAGLSFAVVSWWGEASSGRDGAVNNATLDLFKFLKADNSNFKIAVMVDAYTQNLSQTSSANDYNYVYSTYVSPFSSWYFKWQEKPLLLFFSPLTPSYNDSRFTVRTIGNLNSQPVDHHRRDWIWWTAPSQYYEGQGGGDVNHSNDEGIPSISRDGELTIIPRIDSYHYYQGDPQNRSYLRFDSNLTGLYMYEWNFAIQHRNQIRLVIVYSWNEYYERSSIEPHVEPTGVPSYLAGYTSLAVRCFHSEGC